MGNEEFNLNGKNLGVSDPRTKWVEIESGRLGLANTGKDFSLQDVFIKRQKNKVSSQDNYNDQIQGCKLFVVNEQEKIKVFNIAEPCIDEKGLPAWFVGSRIQYKFKIFNGGQELLFSLDETVRKSEYIEEQLPDEIVKAIEKAIERAEKNSKKPLEDSFT
jgi:hypothetical protein